MNGDIEVGTFGRLTEIFDRTYIKILTDGTFVVGSEGFDDNEGTDYGSFVKYKTNGKIEKFAFD